jgi:prevent-host-death family protein
MCYMTRYARKKPDNTVGVRELRQNLSVYLERVKKGEALTVTDRGQEVAILRPIPKTNDVIERLIAEGRATRPTRDFRDVLRDIAPKRRPWDGDKPLEEILDETREERLE